VQALSEQKKARQAPFATMSKHEVYVAKKQIAKEAKQVTASADGERAALFLSPWQQLLPPKGRRKTSSASASALVAGTAAAGTAAAATTAASSQVAVSSVPAKGTSMLPVAVWNLVVEFLGACGNGSVRGVTAAARAMASAALVCSDIFAATVQAGWSAMAAGYIPPSELGASRAEALAAIECMLRNPLKAKLEHLQQSLRFFKLPVTGKKAVLMQRLLEVMCTCGIIALSNALAVCAACCKHVVKQM
jgi:hypothetical protein